MGYLFSIFIFSKIILELNTDFTFGISNWLHVWYLFDSFNQVSVCIHGKYYFS